MTPDLMQTFQKNAILSRGFQSPKCMAAMELLQKDPQEARRRFQDDPEVSNKSNVSVGVYSACIYV